MKTLLIRAALLLCWPSAAFSQAPAPAWPSSQSTFFKADYSPATSDDSTAFCAETTYRDSLTGLTRVYYPSGRLKQFVPYGDVRRQIVHGVLTTWYEDGTLRTKEDFVAGQRHGDLLTYYPDGALKRRDRYDNGRSGVGTCYAPDGSHLPYFAYEQLPLYPGGETGLVLELERGLRRSLTFKETKDMQDEFYRTLASSVRGWEREVLVELAVAEDGRITNSKVVRSNAPILNNAVLKSVSDLSRQFIPARRDGQVVASYFVVPMKFLLATPPRGKNNARGIPHPTRGLW